MKSVKNFGGRYSTFSNCNFFSDDSSYSASRCSNSSPLVELSSSPSNHCSGDNIRDDTRSLSAVNLSPLIHTVVSIILMVHTCCLLSSNNKRLDGGWISEQLKDFIFITFRH